LAELPQGRENFRIPLALHAPPFCLEAIEVLDEAREDALSGTKVLAVV
jgi:hypothetical protein